MAHCNQMARVWAERIWIKIVSWKTGTNILLQRQNSLNLMVFLQGYRGLENFSTKVKTPIFYINNHICEDYVTKKLGTLFFFVSVHSWTHLNISWLFCFFKFCPCKASEIVSVPDHDGGRPKQINAWFLYTHMVYL
jgi:hypothetical protein